MGIVCRPPALAAESPLPKTLRFGGNVGNQYRILDAAMQDATGLGYTFDGGEEYPTPPGAAFVSAVQTGQYVGYGFDDSCTPTSFATLRIAPAGSSVVSLNKFLTQTPLPGDAALFTARAAPAGCNGAPLEYGF